MERQERLKITEKLLLAAYRLEESGRVPFSAEDLVVSAWRSFPDAFGLAGYRDEDHKLAYPDSNRVFAEIMGTKPIRKRGLLLKVGRKMYQLTEAGREHARLLMNRLGSSQVEQAGLARDIEKELHRLFTSKAIEKYKNGRTNDITFHDACVFWRISARSSAIEFHGRVNNFTRMIEAVQESIQQKTVSFEHGGQAFGAQDLDLLSEVHQQMLKRFQQEIEIIERRTDERT